MNEKTYGDFTCLFFFCEPHDNGEIWANVLWDLREAFRTDLVLGSEAAAIGEMHRIYVDALALSPPSPTMLDLREAMLQADLLRNPGASPGGSENHCRIWTSLAGRGLGQNALDTQDTGDNTVVPNDEIPAVCPQATRVTLTVTDAQAAEAGLDPGAITVTRTGDTSQDLSVFYTVGGTATAGADYVALPGMMVVPAGSSTATLPVIPVDDSAYEPQESVVVTLVADPAYVLGNVVSGTVTLVNDDAGPDLVVATLLAPAAAAAGSAIDVSDTTRNQGAGAASLSTTSFYLSTNAVFDGADVLLGARPVQALAPGASSASVTSLALPLTTAAGNYYVLARADAPGMVLETNETNNLRTDPIAVGPDLVVSVLSIPAIGGAGSVISVGDTTKNQGGGTAPPSSTRFYLSTNAVFDGTDLFLGARVVTELAAGASSAVSTFLTLPSTTPAGLHYILARADGDTGVPETNEANNLRTGSISIGPDLVVSALTAPASSGAGSSINVSDTTLNQGGGASPPSSTRFYLSTNALFDGEDVLIGARSVPGLAANGASTASTPLAIPPATAAGSYYVLARADGTALVSERNETNNQRTDAIAIGPDLVLSTFTAPTAAGAGSSISVSDTTRNQGAGTAPASTTGFYLSTNAIFDDSDVLLGTRSVPELAAAASSSASTSLILPATTAAGIYYVLARADGESSVAETNEANNMRTASISIGPDLVVSALTAPAAAVAGSTISVTDTSRNQGAGQAAAASTSFYLSTNAVFDAADVPLGLRALPELAPGATSAAPTSLTIPHTASAGIHYIPRPCRRRGSRSRDEREQQRSRGRPSPSALPDAGPRLRGPSPWPPWTGHPATGEHESSMITRPLASLPAAPTVSALDLDDVRRCTELLQAIVDDRALLAEVPLSVRQDLLIAAGRVSRPESHKEKHLVKALRRARRNRDLAQDRKARAATGIRVARDAPVFVPPQPLVGQTPEATPRELKTPKACYVCKAEFTRLHHFYDALCPACAELNYAKRFQTASLLGRVGLVTGARVKIGFHTALKMLRAGARVIATTRFPHDAALRYSGEPDFAEWKDRLHVHGLDLRHSPSVEIFARYLEHSFDRLDILVNNACQTVRRPPGFYAHLLENESRPLSCLPQESRSVLRSHEALRAALERGGSLPAASEAGGTALTTGPGNRGGLGITASSALSQVAYAEGDATTRRDLFPTGRTDADLQQVDLRRLNSWRLALADVPTAEMLEVHLVNAVAPFILCARLKPLMLRQPTRDKHIVNVSAMEGVFSRGTKTDKHPHTNMAKAALNMMTLTASRDYVRGGIHMNAVDTGWVTDEDPALHAERKRNELDFQPPLDIVDGASRVCDPFFSGLLTGDHVFGRFLKDYRESSW